VAFPQGLGALMEVLRFPRWRGCAPAAAMRPMAENQQGKPSGTGKSIKLFAIIVLLLLVPMVMDQVEVDRENVKLAGRIAAGIAVLVFAYGIFSKVMKVLAFAAFLLIGGTVLVSEGQIEAPRIKALLSKERPPK
jgi:hypothetical protein